MERPARPQTDDEVQRDVQRELAWDPRVEQEGTEVDVTGGRVTLSGRVRSWEERRAIVGAARLTPGAETVEDQLEVDHFA